LVEFSILFVGLRSLIAALFSPSPHYNFSAQHAHTAGKGEFARLPRRKLNDDRFVQRQRPLYVVVWDHDLRAASRFRLPHERNASRNIPL
jgi:hypothetical protein